MDKCYWCGSTYHYSHDCSKMKSPVKTALPATKTKPTPTGTPLKSPSEILNDRVKVIAALGITALSALDNAEKQGNKESGGKEKDQDVRDAEQKQPHTAPYTYHNNSGKSGGAIPSVLALSFVAALGYAYYQYSSWQAEKYPGISLFMAERVTSTLSEKFFTGVYRDVAIARDNAEKACHQTFGLFSLFTNCNVMAEIPSGTKGCVVYGLGNDGYGVHGTAVFTTRPSTAQMCQATGTSQSCSSRITYVCNYTLP